MWPSFMISWNVFDRHLNWGYGIWWDLEHLTLWMVPKFDRTLSSCLWYPFATTCCHFPPFSKVYIFYIVLFYKVIFYMTLNSYTWLQVYQVPCQLHRLNTIRIYFLPYLSNCSHLGKTAVEVIVAISPNSRAMFSLKPAEENPFFLPFVGSDVHW